MKPEKVFTLSLPYPDQPNKTVRVYVPEHKEGDTFPVIYMTDGQNLFEEENTPFGSWLTHLAVKDEYAQNGQAAIIVGIHNDGSPIQRSSELTPNSIGSGKFNAPEEVQKMISPTGEVFDNFVVNTVMPAVESQFPVKTGRENTAFCGSSSGGLQAFFTALSHPDLFCAAGVFSPVFFIYFKEDLTNWIHSKIKPDMPYLYIYSGAGDELEHRIFKGVEETYDILTECYPPELLNEVILLENKHNETSWREIFKDFLHTFLS